LKPQESDGYINSKDKTKLYYKKSAADNPKASIIIIHGVCEHLGRYDYVAEKLIQYNYNVYRFDYRGHGKSEGKKAHIDNYNQVIEDTDAILGFVKKEEPKGKLFIYGHSFGGFIAVAYGIKNRNSIDGYIVSAPTASDEAGILGLFEKRKDRNEYVTNNLAKFVCSDVQVVENYQEDEMVHKEISVAFVQEMVRGTKWMKKNINKFDDPIFLIHGENDQIVSYLDSEYIYEQIASKDKKFTLYPAMYHELHNEPIKEHLMKEFDNWISQRV